MGSEGYRGEGGWWLDSNSRWVVIGMRVKI